MLSFYSSRKLTTSCSTHRRDDPEAAVPEEKRLCSGSRAQRETLAQRPLAAGTSGAARVQLLRVHTRLSGQTPASDSCIGHYMTCVALCPQWRAGDVGLDQVWEAEVDSVRSVLRGSEPQQDRLQHEFSSAAGRQGAAHQHLHGQRGESLIGCSHSLKRQVPQLGGRSLTVLS